MKSAIRYIPNKRARAAGFTLVEMLVVAPLVILSIGVVIGFMTTITGDALIANERGAISYSAQQALDLMEQDVRASHSFQTTSGTLRAEQQTPTGQTEFVATENNALILRQSATTVNPYNEARQLVHYSNQPNACDNAKERNRNFKITLVYFVHENTLYKRTIVPNYSLTGTGPETLCDKPWQRNTCAEGYAIDPSSTGTCRGKDEKIATNITSFSIEYYKNAANTATTDDFASANTVRIKLVASSKAAGRDVDFRGAVRASRINAQEKPLQKPRAPEIDYEFPSPNTVKFTWDNRDESVFYTATYGVNRSCNWTALRDSRSGSFSTTKNPGDTITFCLTATNIMGTSPTSEKSAMIPIWSTEPLQNGWFNRNDANADTFGFTKNQYGEVMLKGLVQNSVNVSSSNAIIARLPEGYRPYVPNYPLIFAGTTNSARSKANNYSGISIDQYGYIRAMANHADKEWVSLDNVTFIANGACSWSSFYNVQSWWYGTTYKCKDSRGRAHLSGNLEARQDWPQVGDEIAKIDNYPSSASYTSPKGDLQFSAGNGFGFSAFSITPQSKMINLRNAENAPFDFQASYFTPSYSGTWRNVSLRSGWVNDSNPQSSPAQYTKSGLHVSLQGVISGGSTSPNTLIGRIDAGYRPKKQKIFSVVSDTSHARVDVMPDGRILLVDHGSSASLSLAGINFIAEG